MSGAVTLAENMAATWRDRAETAARDLRYAAGAPALFKQEWVERAHREYLTAIEQVAYWTGIGAS